GIGAGAVESQAARRLDHRPRTAAEVEDPRARAAGRGGLRPAEQVTVMDVEGVERRRQRLSQNVVEGKAPHDSPGSYQIAPGRGSLREPWEADEKFHLRPTGARSSGRILVAMEKQGVLAFQVEPIRDHPDAVKVALDGSIDPKTVTKFRDDLMALHAKGARRFLIDCARLTYVNSSGLASLLNLAGTVKPKGGAVALAALDNKIHVIFKMMGILELFQFFPTYKDALRDLDEKLAAELRDGGPALKLEEHPAPPPTPRTPVRTAARVETSWRSIRPP